MTPATELQLLREPGRIVHRPHSSHRRRCRACDARPARFWFRGEVRADREHTLCFRCYRAEQNRQRARRMAN